MSTSKATPPVTSTHMREERTDPSGFLTKTTRDEFLVPV